MTAFISRLHINEKINSFCNETSQLCNNGIKRITRYTSIINEKINRHVKNITDIAVPLFEKFSHWLNQSRNGQIVKAVALVTFSLGTAVLSATCAVKAVAGGLFGILACSTVGGIPVGLVLVADAVGWGSLSFALGALTLASMEEANTAIKGLPQKKKEVNYG